MSWKLIVGVFLLFTGFLSIAGIVLILLYLFDKYKKSDHKKKTYISPEVIEEFR